MQAPSCDPYFRNRSGTPNERYYIYVKIARDFLSSRVHFISPFFLDKRNASAHWHKEMTENRMKNQCRVLDRLFTEGVCVGAIPATVWLTLFQAHVLNPENRALLAEPDSLRKARRLADGVSHAQWNLREWDRSHRNGPVASGSPTYRPRTEDELLARREKHTWRQHKGIIRDKAKRGWCLGRGSAGKASSKKSSNASFRQFTRSALAHERYDDLDSKIRKDFFDPWDWD